MRMYQFRDGLFEAMLHRFKTDPTMAAWGEENRAGVAPSPSTVA